MADPGYTIQSAAPTSTTAALAGNVPLEKKTNGEAPASDVPQVVKDSIAEAHKDPEAAANQQAVEEKKDMEQELHKKVSVEESAGTPAPTVAAATQPTAPGITSALGADSVDVSPNTTPPPGRAAAAPTSAPVSEPKTTVSGVGKEQIQAPSGPTATTGVATVPVEETTTPKAQAPAQQSATTEDTAGVSAGAKEEKKKNRLSGFFSKIKEKLK
jgi:hypothetical protein